jgi:hypothetical protein
MIGEPREIVPADAATACSVQAAASANAAARPQTLVVRPAQLIGVVVIEPRYLVDRKRGANPVNRTASRAENRLTVSCRAFRSPDWGEMR